MCYSGRGVSFNRSKTESERNIRGPAFKAKLSLGVTRCQTSSRFGWVNKPEWNDERDIELHEDRHEPAATDSANHTHLHMLIVANLCVRV